jgi:hypothetical protein
MAYILTIELFYTFLLYANVANLFWCGVALTSFPDDDPLGIETCRDVQCDIVI